MNYYKLGCNWGSGAPDFYDLLTEKNIVIGYEGSAGYDKGDIIALFKGYTAVAIALVTESAVPVTNFLELKPAFEDYEIDYSDKVLVAGAVIRPLTESERFTYSNRKGICRIHQQDVLKNIKENEDKLYFRKKMIPQLTKITDLVLENKNIIIQGAPGTGKTYLTPILALNLIDSGTVNEYVEDRRQLMRKYNSYLDEGRIQFVTFHQSMDYEDFIEGLKPQLTENGDIFYAVENGIFRRICDDAKNGTGNYVLIIDEINRGNISKIFGELITLIEKDKRKGEENEISVTLPYSKERKFSVPDNLYIIGTMNTTDRSTGNIDYAIRRRFKFYTLESNSDLLSNEAKRLYDKVEAYIEYHKTDGDISDLMVGHSYFMGRDEDLNDKWKYEIQPLLKEYAQDGILTTYPEQTDVNEFMKFFNEEKSSNN